MEVFSVQLFKKNLHISRIRFSTRTRLKLSCSGDGNSLPLQKKGNSLTLSLTGLHCVPNNIISSH
jgi:hypothetical protein